MKEYKYRIYGLLPMTKEQIIAYWKSRNELTLVGGKYHLTGGVPVEKTVKGKVVVTYKKEVYSGYEEYFIKMFEYGFVRDAYAPMPNKLAFS